MAEPSLHSSRRTFAGAVAAAILFGTGGFLLGRGTSERPSVEPVQPSSVPPPPPQSAQPAGIGILGRAELIALAAQAADAAASALPPPAEVGEANGRRFSIRLPFGCGGGSEEKSSAAMRWRYDAEAAALRVHVAPVAWTAQDWWTGPVPPGIDAIEGFWIARPWTSSERCPNAVATRPSETAPAAAAKPDADGNDIAEADRNTAPPAEQLPSGTAPAQTLALGQIFSAGGARQGRRNGKAYEAVIRTAANDLDTSAGLHLRLTGRLAAVPGGGVVRCKSPAGAEQRPVCLLSAAFDEVAIERAVDGKVLATWSAAGPKAPDR
jgi:hypothetical protein